MPFHCFSQPLMHLSLTLTLSSLSRLVSFHSLSSSLCLSLFAKVRNPLKPLSFLFLFVFLSSSKVLSLKCFYSCFYFCEGLGFWNFCIFSRSSFHYALSLVNLSESMLCHTTSLHCCFAVAMPPHFVSQLSVEVRTPLSRYGFLGFINFYVQHWNFHCFHCHCLVRSVLDS